MDAIHQGTKEGSVKLSIVVTTRNDDHGGNLVHRTSLFVHTLVEQARRYNLDGELIFVEWNPPQGKPPLAESLAWPSDFGPLDIRVITVPEEEHRKLANSDVLPIFQMIAKNAGIRRARGDWVLATNPDIFFDNRLIEFLAWGRLEEDCYYRATRFDLSQGVFPMMAIDRLLPMCRAKVCTEHHTKGPIHTNACGDFTLLSKATWLELTGYLEYELWSPYVDSVFLYMAYGSGLRQETLPWPVYHPRHAGSWAVERLTDLPTLGQDDVEGMRKACTPNNIPFVHNRDGWGLEGVVLEEKAIQPCHESIVSTPFSKPCPGWSIFSVPTAFQGVKKVQQMNAVRSWMHLDPKPEVLLFGNAEGVDECAQRLGCSHVPDVQCNEYGTPILADVFKKAQQQAKHDILCFTNADIILRPDVELALIRVLAEFDGLFLMTGLRWDVDIHWAVSFSDGWADRLADRAVVDGKFHSNTGADYFIFRRGTFDEMPEFLVGRTAWDNWCILDTVRGGLPVIDVTEAVLVIHQNHEVASSEGKGEETRYNLALWAACKPKGNEGNVESATWMMDKDWSLLQRSSGDTTL